jgi:hypothetical protein
LSTPQHRATLSEEARMRQNTKFGKPGWFLLLAALAYVQVIIVDGFRTINVTTPTFSLSLKPVSSYHLSLKYGLMSGTAEDRLYLDATFSGRPNKEVHIAIEKDGFREEARCVTNQEGRCYLPLWIPDARISGGFNAAVNIDDGERVRVRGIFTHKLYVLSTVW